MNTIEGFTYTGLFDDPPQLLTTDTVFRSCVFSNCYLSMATKSAAMSCARRVKLIDCSAINCDIGPTIFEDLEVRGLQTSDILICWSPVFQRCNLEGTIGPLKINSEPHFNDRSPEIIRDFAAFREHFYLSVDWALDISNAIFHDFEVQGVPSSLIRRDPTTQVVVRRACLADGWESRLSPWNNIWPVIIDGMLLSGQDDVVLAAPKARRKSVFNRLLDGLKELRDLGIADQD
jgi:hypothetical protein